MLSRPTTEQILLDCRAQLLEVIDRGHLGARCAKGCRHRSHLLGCSRHHYS